MYTKDTTYDVSVPLDFRGDISPSSEARAVSGDCGGSETRGLRGARPKVPGARGQRPRVPGARGQGQEACDTCCGLTDYMKPQDVNKAEIKTQGRGRPSDSAEDMAGGGFVTSFERHAVLPDCMEIPLFRNHS